MQSLLSRFLCTTVAVAALMITGTTARSEDPHKLYETRCGGCHSPHAGAFVRGHLIERTGELFGRKSGQEIRAFLESGHGGLNRQEVAKLVMHFKNINRSGGLFRKKCIVCHDRAVLFARNRLFIQDGQLIGRYSKRDIARFLTAHGRLSPTEVSIMVEVLKRHLITAEPATE